MNSHVYIYANNRSVPSDYITCDNTCNSQLMCAWEWPNQLYTNDWSVRISQLYSNDIPLRDYIEESSAVWYYLVISRIWNVKAKMCFPKCGVGINKFGIIIMPLVNIAWQSPFTLSHTNSGSQIEEWSFWYNTLFVLAWCQPF